MKSITKGITVACGVALMSMMLFACGDKQETTGTNAGGSAAPAASPAATAAATLASTPAGPAVMKDAMGHDVKIPANPKRVIAPFLEDGLVTLGVKPVAQWSASGVPQAYLQNTLKDIPVLDMMGGLKPEGALSFNPDLLIMAAPTYLKAGDFDSFTKVAPTFVLSNDESDWRGNLVALGKVLGKSDAAEKSLKDYDAKVQAAKDKLTSSVGAKTAAIFQAGDDKAFKLFGNKFYSANLLYSGLGFKQPKLVKGDYDTYSIETLAQLDDVDYIFVISGKGRAKPPVDNPLWKGLPAVKAGKVFEIDSGHWFNANVQANLLILDDVLKNVVK